jgi:hypothetical protein
MSNVVPGSAMSESWGNGLTSPTTPTVTRRAAIGDAPPQHHPPEH